MSQSRSPRSPAKAQDIKDTWWHRVQTVFHLGIKEFSSLGRDVGMLILIVFMFSGVIYSNAKQRPDALNKAAIAVVDEDQSQLSKRLVDSLQEPFFLPPRLINRAEIDAGMDAGRDTFVLNFPPGFQRDLESGRQPAVQLNVDATRQSQALVGASYIQTILGQEIQKHLRQQMERPFVMDVVLVQHTLFNPNVYSAWFGGITGLINNVTLLSIILTGAALIREREHGTIEHLLVMPITPLQIMISKVWPMAVVVLLGSFFALQVMIRGLIGAQLGGSTALFMLGAFVYLFATTSIGIYMGTLARTMPQFGLMAILLLLPLQILSGSITPRESMPELVQWIMSATPTLHFVSYAQAVLIRGADFAMIWGDFAIMLVIGLVFFVFAHRRLSHTMGSMG